MPGDPAGAANGTMGVPFLAQQGFILESRGDAWLNYRHDFRSGWVILACVLLFPIGLLALLAPRSSEQLMFSFQPNENGESVCVVTGRAQSALAKQIHKIL